ncbi:MAG: hypothetical protein HJJLKODD_02160 [Phycisphaerae bacterium]|nr:hypothetical protein [Phycisphaerae bacterium]
MRESLSFIKQFINNPFEIGAIAPSSKFLAKALTEPLSQHRRPVNVLEIGAGTGAVTKHILPLIGPEDRLDIVEANSQLARHLKQTHLEQPATQPAYESGHIRLFTQQIQLVDQLLDYDYMVSGLPFTSFEIRDLMLVLKKLRKHARPGCILSYFEYIALRPALVAIRRGPRGWRQRVVSAYMDRQIEAHQQFRRNIFLNVPPAIARHLCLRVDPSTPAAPRRSSKTRRRLRPPIGKN